MTAIQSRIALLASLSAVVALVLAACGAAQEEPRLSVPAGAKAGELVDLQDCVYNGAGVEAQTIRSPAHVAAPAASIVLNGTYPPLVMKLGDRAAT